MSQQCGEDFVTSSHAVMNAIEFVALHNHHDTRPCVVFIAVREIACSFQNGESIDHSEGEMLELDTELF